MEKVGRNIIKKCNGVPLAIKVMGSVLKSKHSLNDWEKIEESEIWDLQESKDEIFSSLLLSFNHLRSSSLKQCFAYYAMIPKGHYVYRSELIGLWASQGYLRNDKGTTMEEIGEEHIKTLVSHSLLEEFELLSSNCYRMHDLVHDLAVYVSRDELAKEVKVLREKTGFRHLAFSSGEDASTSDFKEDLSVVTMLRTIDLSGAKRVPWNLVIHARYLRTLFLDRTGIEELPSDIKQLKHLRYLDVSHNPISKFPDSIGKLYQLETLILQNCEQMTELPKVLNTLVSLRHISTTAPMSAWKGLQRLSNLQTLPHLCLKNDGDRWSIDELGELVGLRDDIRIEGLQFVKDKVQARKAGLARKAKVTKLALSWDKEGQRSGSGGICNDEDVLDGLECHPNITSLQVENFNGEKFPTWVTRMAVLTGEQGGMRKLLSNLTVVKLNGCSRCRTLPTLGQLPVLELLVLNGLNVVCIEKEFYGRNDVGIPTTAVPFPSLKELKVCEFSKLTSWTAPPQGAFPHLEILEVRGCRKLKSLPAGLGSNKLTSLCIEDCRNLKSLRSRGLKSFALLQSLLMRRN